jgi:ATP-binding cassette subfamily B protein
LVLNGSLTVGQLVAAQIIVTTSLASLEKLIRQSEKYFDLLAGLDKVAVISELETERDGGKELPALHPAGALVELKNLHFEYDNGHKVLNGLNLTINAGDRVSLVGASGAGKSTLAAVLCGFQSPSMGDAIFENVDIREACLQRLRAQVSLAGYEPDVFHGTIEENIRVGRDEISSADLRWAVTTAELDDDLAAIPGGLQAELVSGGQNISRGQLQRLLIARAILGRPRLLILDEALTGIDERISQRILDNIFEASNPWTIIDISHQPDVILRTDKVHVMAEGRIVESGSPTQLAQSAKSVFSELFPFLSANLRAGTARIGGGK